MAKNGYAKGSLVRVVDSLTVNGVQTDSGATAVAVILKPDGTTVTPSVTRDSVGLYHADVDTTSGPQGDWQYKWTSTTPAQAVAYGVFWVDDPAFP